MNSRTWLRLVPANFLVAMLAATGCEEEQPTTSQTSANSLQAPVATHDPAPTTLTDPAPAVSLPPTAATNEVPVLTNVVAAAVSTPVAPAIPPALSPAVAEVVKMAEKGVSEQILLAYVEQSESGFRLGSQDIVYLNDLGIPDAVITAMIRRPAAAISEFGLGVAEPAPAPPPPPGTVSAGGAPATAAGVQTVTNAIPMEATTATDVAQAPEGAPSPAATVVAAPAASVSYTYIYDSLSPYGSWVQEPDYGWCWRPTVAVIDPYWRPYHSRGRWCYTNYGWYWNSDYTWGWLPFHYGRWCRSGAWGWVWAPGTTWGPAWVSWRYSSGYCGWAPLPPEARFYSGVGFYYRGSRAGIRFDYGLSSDHYTFIPSGHFVHHSPWGHYVPPSRARELYNRSTVVNNYIVGNNNSVVVNMGMGTKPVEGATRGGLRQVQVREIDARELPAGRPERVERDGTSLAVYRPNLPTPAAAPPPQVLQRQGEPRKLAELGRPQVLPTSAAASRPNSAPPLSVTPAINASSGGNAGRSPSTASPLAPSSGGAAVSRLQPESAPRVGPGAVGNAVRPSATQSTPRSSSGMPPRPMEASRNSPANAPVVNSINRGAPAPNAVNGVTVPPKAATVTPARPTTPASARPTATPRPNAAPQIRTPAGQLTGDPTLARQEPRRESVSTPVSGQPPKSVNVPSVPSRTTPSVTPFGVPSVQPQRMSPSGSIPRVPTVNNASSASMPSTTQITRQPTTIPMPSSPTIVMPGGQVQRTPSVSSAPSVVPRQAPPSFSPPQRSYQPMPTPAPAPVMRSQPSPAPQRSAPPSFSQPAQNPPPAARQAPMPNPPQTGGGRAVPSRNRSE